MGRLIDASCINNFVMTFKSDWGIFATDIGNAIDSIVMECPTVEAIPKEKMIEMYVQIIKTSYDTAERYPKYKGIMLYEAEMIIDIMKEYLFKENEDGND